MRLRLAVPLVALLLLPAPATAATWSASDARRDVTTTDFSPEPEPCGTYTDRVVPTDRTTDITRLAVAHGPRSVRIVVGYRDLDARSGHSTTIYLRTSAGDHEVHVDRGEAWGRVRTVIAEMPDYDAIADAAAQHECGFASYGLVGMSCSGLHGDLDPRRDRLVVTMHRSCLGGPRWVRAGASAYSFDAQDSEVPLHHDRWVPKGTKDPGGFDGPYGPRVRVG